LSDKKIKLESNSSTAGNKRVKLLLSRKLSYPPQGFQQLESKAVLQSIPEETKSLVEMSCNLDCVDHLLSIHAHNILTQASRVKS
jgi:hypothetical protein